MRTAPLERYISNKYYDFDFLMWEGRRTF